MKLSVRFIHDETSFLGGNDQFCKDMVPIMSNNMLTVSYEILENQALLRLALFSFRHLIPQGQVCTFEDWAARIREVYQEQRSEEIARCLERLSKMYST